MDHDCNACREHLQHETGVFLSILTLDSLKVSVDKIELRNCVGAGAKCTLTTAIGYMSGGGRYLYPLYDHLDSSSNSRAAFYPF